MGAAYFYHLTRRPLDEVLPALLERARGAGWRVFVRGGDAGRLDALDTALWTYSDESFLPHAIAGGPHDAQQPILLGTGEALPADIACLMCVDGAGITADEADRLERSCILFDGTEQAALEAARAQWRTLTRAGIAAQYWSEENGKWEMKAEA